MHTYNIIQGTGSWKEITISLHGKVVRSCHFYDLQGIVIGGIKSNLRRNPNYKGNTRGMIRPMQRIENGVHLIEKSNVEQAMKIIRGRGILHRVHDHATGKDMWYE